MDRWHGVKERRVGREFVHSGEATIRWPHGITIHKVDLIVRPTSFGIVGGCGAGVSFRQQQQVARCSKAVPQQQAVVLPQPTDGFQPTGFCSRQDPACAIGLNPVAVMATNMTRIIADLKYLQGLSMGFIRID
jgi:hypothetical protein